MKYSQLSEEAKKVAREQYQAGWLETHNETLSEQELDLCCKDNEEEVEYNQQGQEI